MQYSNGDQLMSAPGLMLECVKPIIHGATLMQLQFMMCFMHAAQ